MPWGRKAEQAKPGSRFGEPGFIAASDGVEILVRKFADLHLFQPVEPRFDLVFRVFLVHFTTFFSLSQVNLSVHPQQLHLPVDFAKVVPVGSVGW